MLEMIRNLFKRKPKAAPAPVEMEAAAVSEGIFGSAISSKIVRRITSGRIIGEKNLTYEGLRDRPRNIQLRTLARISPEFARATNIYKSFVNTETTLKTESEVAEEIIKEFLMDMEGIGIVEETQISENVYDLLYFGFMAMQNLGNESNEIIGIRNITPELIDFEIVDSEIHTEVEAVGYYRQNRLLGVSRGDFIPLQSIEHSEPNFYYGAINTTSATLRGNPLFESAISLAISAGEKDSMLSRWLRGQVAPNEVWAIDMSEYLPLIAAGHVKYETVRALAKDNAEKLDASFDNRDETQYLTLDVPVERIVSGTLQQRLSGLESINENYDVGFPRALHVPQSIFGVKRTGSTLNDTQALHEILAFYKNVLLFRRVISRGRTKLYKSKLEQMGNSDELAHGFNNDDPELKSLLNEALLNECEAAQILVDMGAFTVDEIRIAFVSGVLDLTKFPPDHPDSDAQAEAMRKRMEQQQNGENDE